MTILSSQEPPDNLAPSTPCIHSRLPSSHRLSLLEVPEQRACMPAWKAKKVIAGQAHSRVLCENSTAVANSPQLVPSTELCYKLAPVAFETCSPPFHWFSFKSDARCFARCLPSRPSLLFYPPPWPTHAACQSFSRGHLAAHGLRTTAQANMKRNVRRKTFERERRSIPCQSGSARPTPMPYCA